MNILTTNTFRSLFLVLTCWCVGGVLELAKAQDDLSVPGLTDEPVSTTVAPAESGDETGERTRSDTSLFGLIAAGGWAMWILGLFSLAVIGLGFFCGFDIRETNFKPAPLVADLEESMRRADLEAVSELVSEDTSTLGRMMAAFARQVEETGYSTDDNELIRDLMLEAGVKHNRKRARVINYFSVLAQAAPMMGLLGTVSGMIKAFGTLGNKGMGDPSLLAANISEALVTTAAGLVIALPAIFLYFYFRDRLEELITLCEEFGVEMLNRLRRVAYASRNGEAGLPPPDVAE
ncbi:MAG: MotA/TolQ/ExbB proton channel family protein [Verrucomicrobiae bacterium]|nr:MotA/TolQ/ExbB proton channel family protein [Verrucomicrobiae bacterium]